MRTILLSAFLAAAMAAPQPVRQVRQWTTIRDGDARFTAEFPAPPLRETQPNGMTRWMVQLDNDHYAYIVGVVSIPAERMAVGIPRLLDDAVAGGVRNVPGAELVQDKAITYQTYPGRELIVKAPGGTGPLRVVARAIIAGNRLYVTTAVSPYEGFDAREIDRFTASLVVM
jgi:hypothetical protein